MAVFLANPRTPESRNLGDHPVQFPAGSHAPSWCPRCCVLVQPLPENGLGQEGSAASSLLRCAPFVQEFPKTFELVMCYSTMQAFTILYWTPSLFKGPGLASFSGFCFIFVFTVVFLIVFDLVSSLIGWFRHFLNDLTVYFSPFICIFFHSAFMVSKEGRDVWFLNELSPWLLPLASCGRWVDKHLLF